MIVFQSLLILFLCVIGYYQMSGKNKKCPTKADTVRPFCPDRNFVQLNHCKVADFSNNQFLSRMLSSPSG